MSEQPCHLFPLKIWVGVAGFPAAFSCGIPPTTTPTSKTSEIPQTKQCSASATGLERISEIYIYILYAKMYPYIYIYIHIYGCRVQAPRSWSLPLKHSPMVWSLTVQVLVCTVTSSSTVPLVVLLLPTTRRGHYHSVGWGIWNHSTLAHILYIV